MIDCCAVDNDVQTPQLLTNRLHSLKDVNCITYIALESQAFNILGCKTITNAQRCRSIDIDACHSTCSVGESASSRLPKAATRPCDQGDLSFQTVFLHRMLLFVLIICLAQYLAPARLLVQPRRLEEHCIPAPVPRIFRLR